MGSMFRVVPGRAVCSYHTQIRLVLSTIVCIFARIELFIAHNITQTMPKNRRLNRLCSVRKLKYWRFSVAATQRHRKFRPQSLTKPEVKVLDPQIDEQAFQLLARGASQKDLLRSITKPVDPAPPSDPRKFKLLGPLKDQIPELDAWIAEQFAAGKSATEMIMQVVPSMEEQARLRVAREREEKAASTAKRLAARAARNDPAVIADQQARWAARQAKWDKALADREAEDAARKAAIAENPTLRWRTPRRKDWAKKNLANAK